ncbi:MAG: tyrosine-type recombinase/integrase [Kofleriaceae bacterium]
MAEPQKRPNGSWRIQWLDAGGKRRSADFRTFEAARSALRRKQTEVEDIRAGRARPLSDLTLAQAGGEWLEKRKPAPGSAPDVMRRRGNRERNNRQHLDHHILPELGKLRLPEVTTEVVQKFIRTLESKPTKRNGERNAATDGEGRARAQRTLRPATIANVLITLRKMMNDLGYPIRISYSVPESDYGWIKSTSDVARFLAACDPPWFRMACELAVYAGLRQGEVAGLRWDRVDTERGLITIDRSYDGPTKSKHARAVPLAPELAERLKRWRLATGAASKGLVVTIDGAPIESDQTDLGKRARRACKAAAVEPVTFHQLRHTFASHLAERVSLPTVGAVLGHADPKTTARYAHVDTASLARDPRLHLTFSAPSGTVTPITAAPSVHHDDMASGDLRSK